MIDPIRRYEIERMRKEDQVSELTVRRPIEDAWCHKSKLNTRLSAGNSVLLRRLRGAGDHPHGCAGIGLTAPLVVMFPANLWARDGLLVRSR